jgi:tellurium resistance protein TerZ
MALSLVKGQKISLSKEAGGDLKTVFMGLGWDVAQAPAQKSGGFLGKLFGGGAPQEASIDLDASVLLFDANKNLLDVVFFQQLTSKDGSIRHSGDNLTGEGDGDDETITVDLRRLPANVQSLVFTVSSFRGQDFGQVANAYCRMVNADNRQEIARYNLSATGSHTGMIMAKMYLHNGEWKMHALGDPGAGRTFQDMIPAIVAGL